MSQSSSLKGELFLSLSSSSLDDTHTYHVLLVMNEIHTVFDKKPHPRHGSQERDLFFFFFLISVLEIPRPAIAGKGQI